MATGEVPESVPAVPLSERWRVRTLGDIVGQWEAVRKLKEFAASWSASPRPPPVRVVMLEGPPGTGKTSAAFALSADMGWGIVEMNASDARNEGALEEIAGRASITNTFSEDGRYLSTKKGERNLILLDEVDSLSGTGRRAAAKKTPVPRAREKEDSLAVKKRSVTDEGGMSALRRLAETTRQPLILTANDAYPLYRAGALKKENTVRIRLFPVDASAIRPWILRIANEERIVLTTHTFDVIIDRSRGDLRAALNDLEAMSGLPPDTNPEEVLGTRAMESNMFDAVRHFLLCARFMPTSEVLMLTDSPPDDIWPWIEENLPKFAPDAQALYDGLDILARAQLHSSRAGRWRIWSLWSYSNELLAGGVSTAIHRGGPPKPYGAPRAEFPRIFMGMGRARDRRSSRETVVTSLSHWVHMSKRGTTEQILPLLRVLHAAAAAQENETLSWLHDFETGLATELELNVEDIIALFDSFPRAPFPARAKRIKKVSTKTLDS